MKRLIYLVAALLLLPLGAYPYGPQQRLDSVLELYHTHNQFSGTVLVARHGELLYARGFGHASLEHGVPNTPATKFRIASITKQFTSMLVMRQVAAGRMSTDDPIRRYLPDYPSPQGDVVTIHHLLSHTSGFPHYAGIPDFFPLYGRKAFEHSEFVALFRDLELMYEPGTDYSYSSFGYYLLGYILEEVTGKSFGELLREEILDPLGMHDTGLVDHREVLPNKAAGYDLMPWGFVHSEYRDLSTALATGDMYTTVLDMVQWDRALRENRLLEPSLQERLFTPNLSGYGYGWVMGHHRLPEGDSLFFQQHTGGTNGFTSIATRLPQEGYYILVFCNTRPGEIRSIERDILRVLYGREVDFRASASVAAARIMEAEGLETALRFIRGLSDGEGRGTASPGSGVRYRLELQDITGLGGALLEEGALEDGLAFLELAAELYPESVAALLALGDGYYACSMPGLAVYTYAQGLLLNPAHRGLLERMKRF
jgi:CubicO group peptidase (beta-lactamase class C family)